jgi:8-oxo-dGTP pyrophosphatase MutT (NUDIX family)
MKSIEQQLRLFFEGYHQRTLADAGLRRAGVLVPIFEKNGEPHFVLTKRTEDVEHHKGQISFPGGAVDAEDQDIVATALRETEEEIGLSSGQISVIGILNDISIPTGFIVTPVVGFLIGVPTMVLNATEVQCVIEVPFSFFREAGNKRIEKMMRGGKLHDVYFFRFGDHEIWGATAFIIDSFLSALSNRQLV